MEKLHKVMRSISESKAESAPRRDHVTVFREFLDHLDRASRKKSNLRAMKTKATKSKSRRRR